MIRQFFSTLYLNIASIANYSHSLELSSEGEYVIILHGIARSNSHMKKLSTYLSRNGFDVINLSYPSTTYKIGELAEIINQEILKRATQDKAINFVGYSMGGLMVRALIHKYNYKNIGRVVQLAPPNQGSEVADFVKNFWPYKKIFGPAGQQLTTDQSAVKHLFGNVNYELGIVAGNLTIDPISSAMIPGENDGKVAVERTKLDGMKDHVVVNVPHTFFPSSKKVQEHTLCFLKNGKFTH